MNTSITILLSKLIEVEKSIGVESDHAVRRKMHEAEDYALQLQKELAQNLYQAAKCFSRPAMERTTLGSAA
jgi:hypothetical protein